MVHVAEHAPADSYHDRSIALDQHAERLGPLRVATGSEPLQKLAIVRAAEVPQAEERLERSG